MKYRTAIKKQKASLGVVVLGLGGTLVGCNTETSRFEKIASAIGLGAITQPAPVVGSGGNSGDGGDVLPPANPGTSGPVVCDPFSQGGQAGTTSSGARSGLKATLYASPTALSGVNNYVNNENLRVPASIYLSEINTPTRAFSDGFPVQGGGLLTNAQNQTLIEYFGLRIEGTIRLTEGQSAGYMQFGVLADDGAILELKNPVTGLWTMVVDNDGDHGTRLGCANSAIYMQHGVNYEFRVKYYQGPRYHIANMLLWRRVADNSAASLSYSYCDYASNTAWFDSTQVPSVAGPKWIHAQGAGWSVVGAENFSLPASETTSNPCIH